MTTSIEKDREAAYRTHLATRPGGNEWPVDAAWREWADRVWTLVTVKRAEGVSRAHAVGFAEMAALPRVFVSRWATMFAIGYAHSPGLSGACPCNEYEEAAYRLGVAYREWARGGGSHG